MPLQVRLSDFGVAVTALSGGVTCSQAMKGLSFSLAPEMRHARNGRGKGSSKGKGKRQDTFGVAADWCVK